MLFNERMSESCLHAKKWLKPEGVLSQGRGRWGCMLFQRATRICYAKRT